MKTPKQFINSFDKGLVDIQDAYKTFTRYGECTNIDESKVIAGFKTIKTFLYGGVVFQVKMLNGEVKSIVRKH